VEDDGVMDIHSDSVVVDPHHDLLLLVLRDHLSGVTDSFERRWIPELRAGGVDVQVLPIYIEEDYLPEMALRRTLQMIDALQIQVALNPGDVSLCLTGTEIDEAVAAGKIAFVLALEGAEAIGHDLGMLRTLHRLGVRMISFTWMSRTMLADGNFEGGTGGRLTTVGVKALSLMEALGVVMDVSHLNDAGFWHVAELATRPFVASHSSCNALHDHSRNLSDEQLKVVAAAGGVIGINAHPWILGKDYATMDGLLDHIEHAINVAGVEHVGIGPDFCKELVEMGWANEDEMYDYVEGFASAAEWPNVTSAMQGRGWDAATITAILGGNFMRVFRSTLGVPA
jgi:membrane dipeptidase